MVILLKMQFTFVALILFSSLSFADVRIDYDVDDDGLIEVNSLQDLDEIRNNVTDGAFPEIKGNTLYGLSDGCPINGCNGYELTTDLDFDTNQNGIFDEGDLFWNEGKGWQSIGEFGIKFNTEFNGNGYTIKNLVMRRPGEPFQGFISNSEMGYIHDLSISADLVTGAESGGVLALGWRVKLERIHAEIVIKGEAPTEPCTVKCEPDLIGGLVSQLEESSIKESVIKTEVEGLQRIGGVTGALVNSEVSEAAINTIIRGYLTVGGLAGTANASTISSVVAFNDVEGDDKVSGFVGESLNTAYSNILVTGMVTPFKNITQHARGGSLIGSGSAEDNIDSVISLVHLSQDPEQNHKIGAMVGDAGRLSFSNVFWATDLTNRTTFFYNSRIGGLEQSWDLIDIQCANAGANCNGLSFDAFAAAKNSEGSALWQFGNANEAPSIILPMGTFSDKDGNGVADDWPQLGSLGNSGKNFRLGNSGGGLFSFWSFVILGFLMQIKRKR